MRIHHTLVWQALWLCILVSTVSSFSISRNGGRTLSTTHHEQLGRVSTSGISRPSMVSWSTRSNKEPMAAVDEDDDDEDFDMDFDDEDDDFDFDEEDEDYDEDDDFDDEDDQPRTSSKAKAATSTTKTASRWQQLNPTTKAHIIRQGQERAIRNKARTEGPMAKKRKAMMFVREQQRAKSRASRVKRPMSFSNRTALSSLLPHQELNGTVISLTQFGAYVDVGTECDGLLHVSQLSRDTFVSHPKQFVQPGDKLKVRVRSVNAELKKLHLTLLPQEMVEEEQADSMEDDRIPLEDILVDDELWGQLKRVTDFGAYVEVGAVVDGFLHFMDHPSWDQGAHPRDFMARGDRVRVWVSDVDLEQGRIKLTALRPSQLPGPRRELPT